MAEEWYTLDDIAPSESKDRLWCISVDSPDRQFLAGATKFPTHNSEQGKAEDELKGEAAMIIGSIARLGRAAGVHLVIATQRPDAKIISGETKANLGVRINCGRTDSNASSMILGTGEGTQVKSNPRGRLYLRIFASGDHGQGFWADPDWIDKYLASKGLNPDGTPLNSGPKSKLANVTDMSQFEGADLDAREGVDNTAVIERIRDEEAHGNYSDDDIEAMLADDSDWGLDDDEPSGGINLSKNDDDDYDFDAEIENMGLGDDLDMEEDEEPEYDDGPMGRPDLNIKKEGGNPWDRPEDDWSTDLEDLINENYS